MESKHIHHNQLLGNDATREVDGHSDPRTQGPPTTTGGDHLWWERQGRFL